MKIESVFVQSGSITFPISKKKVQFSSKFSINKKSENKYNFPKIFIQQEKWQKYSMENEALYWIGVSSSTRTTPATQNLSICDFGLN